MHTRRSTRCKPPISHKIDRLNLGSAFVRSAKSTRSDNIPDPNPMPIKDGLLYVNDSKSGEDDRFTCRIVTFAKELTSVYICYSTGEWF